MSIIVQKFGGTSVSTPENRRQAAQKILEAKAAGHEVVAVVSAMGRKGAPYATDTLLSLFDETEQQPSLRERDLMMSCGEIISAVVMANLLQSLGCPAVALTGGQAGVVTDARFTRAECLNVAPGRLQSLLKEGSVPVVAGFQGMTRDGDVTTLGRGGSDTSAALLGVALGAEKIEIYTDVDGIMTADPRLVRQARVLEEIDFGEVFQMADQGAKVIHPRAVEVAMRGNIPLVVRNTFSDAPGTRISAGGATEAPGAFQDVVSAIAHISGRTQVTIPIGSDGEASQALEMLGKSDVSIDLINIFPDHIMFTVEEEDSPKTEQVLQKLGCHASYLEGCAKVSIIGHRIRGVPGVMSRIVAALLRKGVRILQTADSHVTISCLVPGEQTVEAIEALHEEFHLNQA